MSKGFMRAIAAAGALTGGYMQGTRYREEKERRDKLDSRQQQQWDREDAARSQQDQINQSFATGAENAGLSPEQRGDNQQNAVADLVQGPQMSLDPNAQNSAVEEATPQQSKARANYGMRHTSTANDEDKMFSGTKSMYETALKLGRPDLAQAYYGQMTQVRDGLLAKANDRAERIYRSTGNISGYIDSYNKYLADGNTIDSFKRNEDGSHVFTLSDGKQSREIQVPPEKLDEYLMALRDPKRVAEIEQRRAQVLFENNAKTNAKMNEPVKVGKDETLIIPGTGQTFAPGGGGQGKVTPKEHLSVFKELSDRALQSMGEFDMTSGKWKPTPASDKASLIAQRVYAGNPNLAPEAAFDIARTGKIGNAVIEQDGQQVRVPAVTYNGQTFLLGNPEAGLPGQAAPSAPKPAGKPAQGAYPAGSEQRQSQGSIRGMRNAPTPEDWQGLKVSPAQQASRDEERRRIIASELRTTPKNSPGRAALEEEARRAGVPV